MLLKKITPFNGIRTNGVRLVDGCVIIVTIVFRMVRGRLYICKNTCLQHRVGGFSGNYNYPIAKCLRCRVTFRREEDVLVDRCKCCGNRLRIKPRFKGRRKVYD